jgi:hypothetical protein
VGRRERERERERERTSPRALAREMRLREHPRGIGEVPGRRARSSGRRATVSPVVGPGCLSFNADPLGSEARCAGPG